MSETIGRTPAITEEEVPNDWTSIPQDPDIPKVDEDELRQAPAAVVDDADLFVAGSDISHKPDAKPLKRFSHRGTDGRFTRRPGRSGVVARQAIAIGSEIIAEGRDSNAVFVLEPADPHMAKMRGMTVIKDRLHARRIDTKRPDIYLESSAADGGTLDEPLAPRNTDPIEVWTTGDVEPITVGDIYAAKHGKPDNS